MLKDVYISLAKVMGQALEKEHDKKVLAGMASAWGETDPIKNFEKFKQGWDSVPWDME